MDLEGSLKEFSLADIFQLIYMQQKDGVLHITLEKEFVEIVFKKGLIIFVSYKQRETDKRLGNLLLRLDLLDDKQLKTALQEQKKNNLKLGEYLTTEGIISKENLAKAIRLQIEETIYDLFRWPGGNFKFHSKIDIDYDLEGLTPLDTQNLIMEGIRQLDERPMIEKAINSMDMVFTKTIGSRERIVNKEDIGKADVEIAELEDSLSDRPKQNIALTKNERAIYNLIDCHKSVKDILNTCDTNKFDTLKILYGLLKTGLIEELYEKDDLEIKRSFINLTILKNGLNYILTIIFIICLGALIGFVSFKSFLNFKNTSPKHINEIKLAIERNKVFIIPVALEIYKLNNRKYPERLDKLVEEDLISLQDKDLVTNNYRYVYSREKDSYQLQRLN